MPQNFRNSGFQFLPHLRVLHHEALVEQTPVVAGGGWQAMGVKTCRPDMPQIFRILGFQVFRFSGFLRMHQSGHLGVGGEPVSEGGKNRSDSGPDWPPGAFSGGGQATGHGGGRARRHGRLWWDFALNPVRQIFSLMGGGW
jgi:hypothetical protein